MNNSLIGKIKKYNPVQTKSQSITNLTKKLVHSRRKTNKCKVESDTDSSSSEGDGDDKSSHKKAHKAHRDKRIREMIAAAARQEVACERDESENIIVKTVRQEVAKKASTDTAPNLPEGNNLVTIDEHLSNEIIANIVNDKYIELLKLSSTKSVRGKEEYQLVYDKQGNKVYKPVKKSKEIDNIFKYFSNMFIMGTCYLRHKPESGPQFMQYLFNILE